MATPHTAPAPQGTGSVTPERDRLLALINANWSTQVIAAAIDLGLPDAMAAGRCDPQSLADASAAHTPSLLRPAGQCQPGVVHRRRRWKFPPHRCRSDAALRFARIAQRLGGPERRTNVDPVGPPCRVGAQRAKYPSDDVDP